MRYKITDLPDGKKEFQSLQSFPLAKGGSINPLVLVYETYGTRSANNDNIILIHHAISTNSHVCSYAENAARGWWQEMVGPKHAIDTEKFFVICINNLGSCFGSSGPASMNAITNQPYRLDFPKVTITDMVRSQQLLLSYLGINQLHAVIGNSMGAMLSLIMAIEFPALLKKLISVSSCYRAYPVSIGYHAIAKEIIKLDPNWCNGYYAKNPQQGLKLARQVGLMSYRNADELNARFLGDGDIRDYLDYNADKLASQFDANSYMYLLDAMDDFDVTRGYENPLIPFQKITASSLVISVDTDLLFPPQQQQELYEYMKQAGVAVELVKLHSPYGHDAFYTDKNIGEHIKNFLSE